MKTTSDKILRHHDLWRSLVCILVLAATSVAHAASPPGISNIRAAQRDGTKLVDIQFDLNPVGGGNVSISILVSSNSGGSWEVPARTFIGDHGANISPGEDKWVVWDAGADWNGQYTANCRVRVLTSSPTLGDMPIIPAGNFLRGDAINGYSGSIHVSAFHIDCGEVTGTRWNEVYQWAIAHGYTFDRGAVSTALDHPVPVSWYDSAKWSNARSEMEGWVPCYYTNAELSVVYRTGQADLTNDRVKWVANGYRLPTEAEWEKAAHGGLTQKLFPWGDRINQRLANYYADTSKSYDDGPDGSNLTYGYGTSPVGSFPPNGYGLFDMAGNYQEWCWDWYGDYTTEVSDPKGPAPGVDFFRVLRGGMFSADGGLATCGSRSGDVPSLVLESGFRCVRGL